MATSKKSMYAWTDIKNGDKLIKAGDSVSKGDFEADDWEQLVEARSVRPQKFPDMPADFGGSPREFMVARLNQQLEETEELLADDDDRQAVATGMTGEPSEDEEVKEAAKDEG